jgi:hypothetical protein
MSPHWVLESDARTLLPFTPTVIGLKSESLGVKLSVPKSHLEPPFEWPGIHLHHAPCDIEKNPEVLPMKENNENIERCLRDCKGMRISYQPSNGQGFTFTMRHATLKKILKSYQ